MLGTTSISGSPGHHLRAGFEVARTRVSGIMGATLCQKV